MLLPNPRGDYRFLLGIEPYSGGVIADAGYEILHTTLMEPLPWRDGFALIAEHLLNAGRTRNALCGIELRCPTPHTRQGFLDFNRDYQALLDEWGLLVEGENPVARTNVAPAWNAPRETVLHAFSYTTPAPYLDPARRAFVVAGAGELRGGPLLEAPVVFPGDRSADGLREKIAYVMRAMSRRLEGLGVSWDAVTATDVYTVADVAPLLGDGVLDRIGLATRRGLTWHHARPPIDELDFEMDVRGVVTERFL